MTNPAYKNSIFSQSNKKYGRIFGGVSAIFERRTIGRVLNINKKRHYLKEYVPSDFTETLGNCLFSSKKSNPSLRFDQKASRGVLSLSK